MQYANEIGSKYNFQLLQGSVETYLRYCEESITCAENFRLESVGERI